MAATEGRTRVPTARDKVVAPRRKSELTRQRILEAAAKVFRDKGYAHTRIVDVAQEAQSHAGAIYYYFSSRDEMVEEVLVIATNRLYDAVHGELAALAPDVSFRERIRTAITAHLLHILTRDIFTAAFTRIHNQLSPEMHDRYAVHLHKYGGLWRALILDAIEAGELRTDLDPTVMRLCLMGSLIWSLEWYREGRMTPEEIGRQISVTFFEGNAPPAS